MPAGGILALVLVAALGPDGPPQAEPPRVPRKGSVMLMSGIDSRSGSGAILEIDPHRMGWTCERTFYFSYAGPGDGQPQRKAQCPVTHGAPYEQQDTLRSRDELVPFLGTERPQCLRPAADARQLPPGRGRRRLPRTGHPPGPALC